MVKIAWIPVKASVYVPVLACLIFKAQYVDERSLIKIFALIANVQLIIHNSENYGLKTYIQSVYHA
jgi:hypothetical protein